MTRYLKRIGPLALRLLAVLVPLGWPQGGSAAGTWSLLSLPQKPGEVRGPTALATDAAGNLYVAYVDGHAKHYWMGKTGPEADYAFERSGDGLYPGQ